MINPDLVINLYNRLTNQSFSAQDLKGKYIPTERRILEQECGVDLVNEVFGEATPLEKTETMLFEIEKMKLEGWEDKKLKHEYLLKIPNEISKACQQLDANNPIGDKYFSLCSSIPIVAYDYDKMPLYAPQLKKEEMSVSEKELGIANNWLNKSQEQDEPKRAHIEYVFELVYISLKSIFSEVKSEIMGQ